MEPMCNGVSQEEESHEILGSVTHTQLQESETGDKSSGIQLRTSARVFKKLKLDSQHNQQLQQTSSTSNASSSSVASVKKDNDDKPVAETKPKGRRAHEVWSPEDKNAFFEALNEYGKDFDAIQQHIGLKAKKRGEQVIKNRDQARHFYHRTWHKISKHLRFPEGVKKPTQELYGLINFGEFRKKVGFVTEKNCVKLNEMIYFGSTQIRIKGKTFRIKTPICKALRKLNEFEECAKEVKLPSRIIVELKPRHNEAWVRVQSLAHNPRVRTELPLNRRLFTLIMYFQSRWRLHDDKQRDRLLATSSVSAAGIPPNVSQTSVPADNTNETKSVIQNEWIFCVAPRPGTQRVEASFKLSAIITSDKLSLLSHADRLGNDYRYMLQQLQAANKGKLKLGGIKRPRTESSGDKNVNNSSANLSSSSNIPLSNKNSENEHTQNTSVVSSLFSPLQSSNGISPNSDKSVVPLNEQNQNANDNQPLALNLDQNDAGIQAVYSSTSILGVNNNNNNNVNSVTVNSNGSSNNGEWVSPVKDDFDDTESVTASKEKTAEILERVKSGWNANNAGTTRIGELYVMFGSSSKLLLDYWWERTSINENNTDVKLDDHQNVHTSSKTGCDALTPLNPTVDNSVNNVNNSSTLPKNESDCCDGVDSHVASTLKKLVSIAKLSLRKTKVQCPCGHICDSNKNIVNTKYITRRVPSKLNRPSDSIGDKTPNNAVNIVQTNNPTEIGIVATSLAPRNSQHHGAQIISTDLTNAAAHGSLPLPIAVSTVVSTSNINSNSLAEVSFISKPVADAVFKRPLIAPSQPKTDNSEAFKAQLDKFRLSRYCNRRGRTTKNVVVSRMLPLLPKMPPKVMVIGSTNMPNYKPIVPAPVVTTTTIVSPTSSVSLSGSILSGMNNTHQQQHHSYQKSKLNFENNINSNINNSSSQNSSNAVKVPVLFTKSPISIPLQPTSSFLENKTDECTLSVDEDKNVSSAISDILGSSIENLNSGNFANLPLSTSSPSILPSTKPSETLLSKKEDNAAKKIFDGLLSGDDISLLNPETSDNTSIIDSSNTHNIDLQSNPPSPTRILKEDSILISTDDYSLSSLLGHLESPSKDEVKNNNTLSDDSSLPDLHSLMCEDSMEFMGKFADLAAHINSESSENK